MNYPQFNAGAQVFPQPNGNVYVLNTTNEFTNIPTTAGLSVGICLNEGILTMKSFQNGAPAQLSYRLVPLETNAHNEDLSKRLDEIEVQLKRITTKLGGEKVEWQI